MKTVIFVMGGVGVVANGQFQHIISHLSTIKVVGFLVGRIVNEVNYMVGVLTKNDDYFIINSYIKNPLYYTTLFLISLGGTILIPNIMSKMLETNPIIIGVAATLCLFSIFIVCLIIFTRMVLGLIFESGRLLFEYLVR